MKLLQQRIWVLGLTLLTLPLMADGPAVVASLEPSDLVEYDSLPQPVQGLIDEALALTKRDLYYRFGSNSPENGGMDCSGAVQYTLNQAGMVEVPRSSYKIYHWANDHGTLISTREATTVEDPVFDDLQPGDLLFWEGTYEVKDRDPPISHVMIYLGRHKQDGLPIMFGSSDGRHYRRTRINGVSVFDWRIPRPQDSSRFVAYGPIPGLLEMQEEAEDVEEESGVPSASAVPASGGKSIGRSLKSALDKVFR